MTIVSSSSKEIMTNPARLIEAMRAGSIISVPDLDYTIVPTTAIAGLADERAEEELLEEMVSYRKDEHHLHFAERQYAPRAADQGRD
jgi:hypothetical protein